MAVFTPLTKTEIETFIATYPVGKLISFEGILQGVDNTNYKIETTEGRYILTIFESRIDPNDLPFFLGLMAHLSENKIICPYPISHIAEIKNKPAALFSFIEGRDVKADDITPSLCYELGILLGKMHLAGQSFPMRHPNSMSFNAWESRFNRVGAPANKFIEKLHTIKAHWPQNLPSGAIHADLFPDNVFIKGGHIYGAIDFYFAATDFLAYDLSIVMNAWCFDGQELNVAKWNKLLGGYQSIRPLTQEEKDSYQIICQGAAMRFLSSRLHDFVFHNPQNLVTPKPPTEYIQKLEFHLNAKLF